MPEGPELHLASLFINKVCNGRFFSRIRKSDVSKNPMIEPPSARFMIGATARGKETKVTLTDANHVVGCQQDKKSSKGKLNESNTLDIVFTFGLAGKFEFCQENSLHKHAHLQFFTDDDEPDMVLSFVDYMRFGKWTPRADFSYKNRGPCVLTDYEKFRAHVLQNIKAAAFDKPICEVLLNQKYFNGIGNYLRAEILHRLSIPPFVSARSVLQPLAEDIKIKSECPDLLQLCNIIPKEVVALESSWYDGGDRSDDTNPFNNWLQCYYQDGMNNMVDHNKRTIWYSGPAGPLAPKEGRTRGKKRSKSKKKSSNDESDESLKLEGKEMKQEVSDSVELMDKSASKSKRARLTASKKQTNSIDKGSYSGRLTRGKIQQIVDTIENLPTELRSKAKEKKVKSSKRTNKSKVQKTEDMDYAKDELTISYNGKCMKKQLLKSEENNKGPLNKGKRGSLKSTKKSLKRLNEKFSFD